MTTFFDKVPVDISIEFLGKKFENPFVLAATPSTDEYDMIDRAFESGWAGAVLKTTNTGGVKDDLAYPLIASNQDQSGSMNCLGNIDLTSAYSIDEIENRIKQIKIKYPTKIVIVSISGSNKEEWKNLANRASKSGADLIECSFSCPQGSIGLPYGRMLSQDENASKEVASWIVESSGDVPVIIKLTPQVADVLSIAKGVVSVGAKAVCLGNSMPGILGIDADLFSPLPVVDGHGTACGISGESIRPISLKAVADVAKEGIQISASGGLLKWSDALEFILLGSGIVQFGTAVMYYGFNIIDDLKSGLSSFMFRKGFKNISEIKGKALKNYIDHSKLSKQQKVRPNIDVDKCVGDGACLIACRDGGHMAISFSNERKPIVDDNKCVGCGLCTAVCPIKSCIKMEKK